MLRPACRYSRPREERDGSKQLGTNTSRKGAFEFFCALKFFLSLCPTPGRKTSVLAPRRPGRSTGHFRFWNSAVVKSTKRQVAAFDRECECTRALTTRRLRPAAGRARRHETSVQLSIGSRARSDEAGGWNRGRIKPYKQGTLIRARPPSTAFRPRERGLRLLPNTPPLPSSTVAKMQASSRFIR